MKWTQKAALVLNMIDRLKECRSLCGKTHVQKTAYFLQAVFAVPTGFHFIMYKFGPFSFDLRDELTSLRADNLLSVELTNPYVPSIVTTELGRRFQKGFPDLLRRYEKAIHSGALIFGRKRGTELEQLATALFVTLKFGDAPSSEDKVAEEMLRLKPRIPITESLGAVRDLCEIRRTIRSA